MGREIRRVPASWDHPRFPDDIAALVGAGIPANRAGMYRPMFCRNYEEDCTEWGEEMNRYAENYLAWQGGLAGGFHTVEDIDKYQHFDLFYGRPEGPPNPCEYMPTGDWFQLFENVSDGTPLSPPFATEGELVHWLSNNNDFWGKEWSPEAARGIVESGWAPSMIFTGGAILTPNTMTYETKGDRDEE